MMFGIWFNWNVLREDIYENVYWKSRIYVSMLFYHKQKTKKSASCKN